MKKGLFITFEGIEASGKTTISKYLKENQLSDYFFTREPGGANIKISEDIRKIILDKKNTNMTPKTEALLYAASRAQNVAEIIIPKLNQGINVISDRYFDSSIVYQGRARNIDIKYIKSINDFIVPDITFLFDISLDEMIKRLKNRKIIDRLDQESFDFHKNVYQGYQDLLKKESKRFIRIDGTKSIKEIADIIVKKISEYEK